MSDVIAAVRTHLTMNHAAMQASHERPPAIGQITATRRARGVVVVVPIATAGQQAGWLSVAFDSAGKETGAVWFPEDDGPGHSVAWCRIPGVVRDLATTAAEYELDLPRADWMRLRPCSQ
jgi:hypothetical protein